VRAGFSGTRDGMTLRQIHVLGLLLTDYADDDPVFTHGDCQGADEEAHALAICRGYQVLVQPCDMSWMRAGCEGLVVLPPLPPLKRNHNIVDFAELMFVCPKQREERRRSGTWATWRYARKLHRPTILIYPNGGFVEQDLHRI